MTGSQFFDEKDLAQMENGGMDPIRACAQLSMFKKGPGFLDLARPASPGDGMVVFSEAELENYASAYESSLNGVAPIKFVPASGAATRMFKSLSALRTPIEKEGLVVLRIKAAEGNSDALSVVEFFNNLKRFAFYGDLEAACKKAGKNLSELLELGNYGPVFRILLDETGLGYKNKAKGLIPFHFCEDGPQTAFEEHILEAADYVRDSNGVCRLHFTVPENQRGDFETLLESIRGRIEKKLEIRLEVEFSVQDPSTDTIAANEDFTPFRTQNGDLFFRPGGHGALISNLDRVKASPIFIANIDNVTPCHLKAQRVLWKKALAGFLLELKDKIAFNIDMLEKNHEKAPEVLQFAKNSLFINPPEWVSGENLVEFLIKALSRPVRVCGMVKNLGDPGGAPFWVKENDGRLTLQIVESAQVVHENQRQAEIFRSSSHFNPVDVTAWVYDSKGEKFALTDFVNEEAVFISKKSVSGKNLLALELPGLWNGAMSDWVTVFVEVPMCEYNPVKSVNDLLKPSHCALSADCS